MRYHAFYKVFLAQPVQLAVDVGHEVGYIFLVHLHFLEVVYHLEQLFFAYLLAGGHFACNEFLADDVFYGTHLAFFAQVDDGDGSSGLAGTSRASAAVGIAFGIIGQSVVDDMGQVVHIQSACGNVCGNQQLQVADAELLHHGIALCLAQFAVQRVGVVAFLHQLVGYLLRLLAGAAEDDAVYLRIVVYNTF